MTKEQIDCEQALKQIVEFIDHELDEHEHAAMQQHLKTCKSCFSRAEFERRLQEKLGALCDEDVLSQLDERIRNLLKTL